MPEGTGQGADPTVEHLAEAGEGSTVPEEDIARGVGTAQEGTGRQGTAQEGTGRQVVGTGEAAHLDLWK